MKVGVIVPIPELDLVRGRPFHLCLSHLLSEPTYADFYRREAENGAYITLDNSAHEQGAGQKIGRLLEQAAQIKASEVVLPDYLFDHYQTAILTGRALADLSGSTLWESSPLRVMIVPQGSINDPGSYWTCRRWLSELLGNFQSELKSGVTIGLSKDYEVYPGGMDQVVRLSLARQKLEKHPTSGAEHHLLGWGRDLAALGTIAQKYPGSIRSTDSAKPIMFALAGIDLSEVGLDAKYPGRAKDFFGRSLDDRQRAIARNNIRVFEGLAQGC